MNRFIDIVDFRLVAGVVHAKVSSHVYKLHTARDRHTAWYAEHATSL